MEQLLLDLLNRLEGIGERDESLYDTVVREKMREAVFFAFIKPTPGYALPGMFRDIERFLAETGADRQHPMLRDTGQAEPS